MIIISYKFDLFNSYFPRKISYMYFRCMPPMLLEKKLRGYSMNVPSIVKIQSLQRRRY